MYLTKQICVYVVHGKKYINFKFVLRVLQRLVEGSSQGCGKNCLCI